MSVDEESFFAVTKQNDLLEQYPRLPILLVNQGCQNRENRDIRVSHASDGIRPGQHLDPAFVGVI